MATNFCFVFYCSKVYTIEDIEIKKKDLDSLNGNNLLTDSIILGYMKTFNNNNIYFLSSNVASQIAENGETLSDIREKLNSYTYAAGPVHIMESKHWCLLFVSFLSNEVTYIDPYGASETKCTNVTANWAKFSNNRSCLKDKTWSASPHCYGHIRQQDNFSCGVFVCHFFEILLHSDFKFLKKNFELIQRRKLIKQRIVDNE